MAARLQQPPPRSLVVDATRYGATGNTRVVADAVITNGSPIVTSATAAFTQDDVGKLLHINDSSVGGNIRLKSTILSVQSATQCTAAANAASSLGTRVMQIGTDDAAAIQAAITAAGIGGRVVLPGIGKVYKIASGLTLLSGTVLSGQGAGNPNNSDPTSRGTTLDTTYFSTANAISGATNGANCQVRDLFLQGPGQNAGSTISTCVGISAGATGALDFRIADVTTAGYYKGISLVADQNTVIRDSWITGAHFANLYANGSSNLRSDAVLYANCTSSAADAANVLLDGGASGVHISAPVMDEGAPSSTGGTLNIKSAVNVIIDIPLLFLSNTGNGIYIGAASSRITILRCRVVPFAIDGGHVPVNTIKIVAGASDVQLIGVTTVPNGGGDISDGGTNTSFLNVNGAYKFPGLPTADPHVVGQIWANSGVMTVSAG